MTSSHRNRLAPAFSRLTAPSAAVSNSPGRASTVPSVPVLSRGISSARVSIAVLLYLGSIGLVGGVTAGLFFGSGFLLLDQSSEQVHAASLVHDHDTEAGPLRPGGSYASAENGTPLGEDSAVLSSTAIGAALIAPAQTAAALDKAGPNWKATLIPSPLDEGSDHFRETPRASHSRSDPMLGKARIAAGRFESAKPDRGQDPEGSAADSANQQQYNQLHAGGPAVNLAADAVEPLAPR
jgi:hypothetical protein